MLDSLVRVSRRVEAFTDLLGRERRTATEALLAVQVRTDLPVGSGARTPGANAEAKTSSQAFGPSPTVPAVKPPGDAPAERAGSQRPVIADPATRAARNLRLGPGGKLRGKLRLLPYSFTYS